MAACDDEQRWRRRIADLEAARGAAYLDRELARTYDRLRVLRHCAGRTAEAGALLQRAVDLAEARVAITSVHPVGDAAIDLSTLRIGLAALLERQGRLGEAAAVLTTALVDADDHASVLRALARVRWREGRVCVSLALAFRATLAGVRMRMRTWQSSTRHGGH